MDSLVELYKIGHGPSSSHTMGPAKACQYLKEHFPEATRFEITLYGSLALTGKGHLTDIIILNELGPNTKIVFDIKSKVKHPNTFIAKVFNDESQPSEPPGPTDPENQVSSPPPGPANSEAK